MKFFPVSSTEVTTSLSVPSATLCLERHVRISCARDSYEMRCGFGATASDTSNLMIYKFGEPLYLTNPDMNKYPYVVFLGRLFSDTWNVCFSDSGDFYQPIVSGTYTATGAISTNQLPGTGRLRVLGRNVSSTAMYISFGGPNVGLSIPPAEILENTEHIFENVNTSHFALLAVGGSASVSVTSGAI